MGLFDFFGRKSGARAFEKHAARAANKRAQGPDRWASLQALGEMKTPEAVEALLQRFTFRVDPSITDQEEKDLAFHAIVGSGEVAIEPVKAFLRESDAIAWPVKMLQKLVVEAEVVGELVALLESMDTEYERDPQKKIDTIMQLEEYQDERIRPAVEPFLDDVNEATRFHAVGTLLRQEDASASREALLKALAEEESVRVRVVLLDGFIEHDWELGKAVSEVQKKLPTGYVLDGTKVRKK
ncbi:MAG TPA: HEAT repeat domain-containing protein [Polyangiaceae bacterium LLY-WYZ-15_(1-7)]|nr:hypothetical protein [Sandaracinus sp.]HJK94240.1 HEAT repeat domain-containing protein [Polyangiaceae bacterium LLY-WYZ-15_(1-7)]MBJ70438.1 hypothetical protein [Sandaracinus sp.]HJL02885.1 HEAT repeat domain-containing protein [Polyangiaceae bacterium LLY-WYZ-15_(1-7)]HJL07487.1 HEAT repeat domain-containing protein [Polyangiaceae bacterium LLY-WYZ-15_(1-7)]